MAHDLVPIESVQPYPGNPHRGDVPAITASIDHVGFYGAIIVQRSTGLILAGNHRWKALKGQGATHVPVVWADVDDETARRILLVDNRASDLGGYDPTALAALASLMPDGLLDALSMRVQEGAAPSGEGGMADDTAPETKALRFEYPADEYDEVTRLADGLRETLDLPSNADLLWALIGDMA